MTRYVPGYQRPPIVRRALFCRCHYGIHSGPLLTNQPVLVAGIPIQRAGMWPANLYRRIFAATPPGGSIAAAAVDTVMPGPMFI